MPFRDVLQNLGDALSGTDRGAAYRKGMAERANIDATEAQTQASMALARDRRIDSEKKLREQAAADELRRREKELNDPEKVSGIDVMEAGFGDEYANLQLGRGRAQEYNLRGTVAEPSVMPGLGDELVTAPQAEAGRGAALEALAPAAALASRRPGSANLEMVQQPDGSSIYVPRREAVGQTVGGRPSTASGSGPGSSGIKTADSSLLFRQSSALFGGTYDPTTGRFAGLDKESAAKVQRIASRASAIFKRGGIDHATAVDQALDEMQQAGGIAPQFGDELQDVQPGADEFDGQTATGPDGEKVIWRNGKWESLQ